MKVEFAATVMLRRTTANLLQLEQRDESKDCTEFRESRVKAAAERLHKRLSPLANPEDKEQDRQLQLEAIIGKIAQLGNLLLLQPTTYQFEWFPRQRHASSTSSASDHVKSSYKVDWRFMTFPALLVTGDSTGRRLRRAELLCEPEYLDEDDIN